MASPALINTHITNLSERWQDVYAKAENKAITSIQVTFLSNMLSIIK